MEPALPPLLPALLRQAGDDIDYQAMALWARLTIDVAMLLLGAVLGAAGANTYHLRRARFVQQALSPSERRAVAGHLASRGAQEEALLLGGPAPATPAQHSGLLAQLSPEEREAVAARLQAAGPLARAAEQGPWLVPPASAALTSREATARLRAEAQARRARQLGPHSAPAGVSAAEAGPSAGPPGAAAAGGEFAAPGLAGPEVDSEALAKLWRRAAEAFEAWVKSPPEGWLSALELPAGPAQALDAVAGALADGGVDPEARFVAASGRAVGAVREELTLARRVLEDTRRGLAAGAKARERSLQIASTAQYALGELRESAALVERLVIEDKLARL